MIVIDETKIIKKLQNRIDEFVKTHPDKKDCESVQTIKEFIQLLESEAAAGSGWIPCGERMPDVAGHEVLATLENKYGQRRCKIVFTGYGDFKWHCNNKEFDLDAWKVIAWQPLPKTY